MSTYWVDTISVVVAFTVAGAFIDFWIGKAGQDRVRKWLEHKWLLFSDVHLDNFGRSEADFAVTVLDVTFGRTLSSRRLCISLLLLVTGLFYSIAIPFLRFGREELDNVTEGSANLLLAVGSVVLSIVLFNVTLAITRTVAAATGANLPETRLSSFLYIAVLIIIQYALMFISEPFVTFGLQVLSVLSTWRVVEVEYHPLTEIWRSLVLTAQTDSQYWSWWPYSRLDVLFDFGLDSFTAANIFAGVLSAFTNISRLAVLALFLLSFLFRPLQALFLTFWARVVETDQPVFTFVLGGAAAFLKSVQELIKVFT